MEATFSVCSFCRPWWQPISHNRREALSKLKPFPNYQLGQASTLLGTSGVWEMGAFCALSGANTTAKCKMKPTHSCTFWRHSPFKRKKRKRHFKVSAWQDRVESLSRNIKTAEAVQAKYFIPNGSSLEVCKRKTARYHSKCNWKYTGKKGYMQMGTDIKSRC